MPSESLFQSMFPAIIETGNPTRKNAGKTVIAHISDLHFTAETDYARQPWNALLTDLTETNQPKIDLLVVTGDLIDAPFSLRRPFGRLVETETSKAFKKVRSYLKDLCEATSIDPAKAL